MRLPYSFSSGSRNPEQTSNETEAVLVVACAMIAILVAILNADAHDRGRILSLTDEFGTNEFEREAIDETI